jgi:hypothetical protein
MKLINSILPVGHYKTSGGHAAGSDSVYQFEKLSTSAPLCWCHTQRPVPMSDDERRNKFYAHKHVCRYDAEKNVFRRKRENKICSAAICCEFFFF